MTSINARTFSKSKSRITLSIMFCFCSSVILLLGLLRDALGGRASFSVAESRAPERRFPLLSGLVSYFCYILSLGFTILNRLGFLYKTAAVCYTNFMRFTRLTLCGFLALLWRFSYGVVAGLQLGACVALGDECLQRHEVGTGHWHVAIFHGWHVEVAA